MKSRHKIKIRTIGFCCIIALVLIASLILCLTMVNTINRRMNASATSSLLSTTQVIADTLESYIQRDYDSLNVVGDICLKNGTPDSDELLAFRNSMELDWLGIVDEEGNGLDCYGESFLLADYSSTHSWQLAEPGYSNAYIGRLSGRPQITFWVPIYEDSEYRGTVLGNVLLSQYYSTNVFTFYEGAGRTYLFDASNGAWILKSLGTDGTATRQADIYTLLSASGNSQEDIDAFRGIVESGKAGTAVLNFNGERSYLCFLPMPSSPNWYVTTVIAKDILLQESSEVQGIIGLVLITVGVLLTLASLFLGSWFVRKTKTDELQYRETLFANISANLDSAFLIYDKIGRKTAFVSDNIKRLLGLDRAWLSEDAAHLFDWCGLTAQDSRCIAFLEGRLDKPSVCEFRMANELGQNTRTIRLELIPADLNHEIAVLTDITKDKEIQSSLVEAMQRVETASNAKNNFLSSMSHDLRTPINGIAGMTMIAAAHLDDRNRLLDCLGKINESTAHLLSLINEVLDMSQIESGKMELSTEPFNLGDLLQDVLSMNYPGIQQKNHDLNIRIHLLEHEKVVGDPARLTRVVTNLLSNAIKYTPSGGKINVTLEEKKSMMQGYGCYELVVQDNGIGMAPHFLEKLYEPFEREEDVRIGRIQGTGLGMSIVKNIIELMMGNIQVESQKGKGTTFRITFHLMLDEHEETLAKQLTGLPVLVVDDDTDNCDSVVKILCSIGMEGEWADSGAQAIDMVVNRHQQGKDYLAILLDWKMPGIDGVETARRIRASVGSEIPIIILTAYEWGEIESDARAAGVNAFLSKPLYKTKLLQKMTDIAEGNFQDAEASIHLPTTVISPGKRILLAEDNELNMEIAIELLRMMGIHADWAPDGAAVVEQFFSCPPGTYDMILMDIQMPKLNGYEAAAQIRHMDERPDARTIPIVAMTADAFKKDKEAAYKAGMNDHLSKPISLERLTQVLNHFLNNSRDR